MLKKNYGIGSGESSYEDSQDSQDDQDEMMPEMSEEDDEPLARRNQPQQRSRRRGRPPLNKRARETSIKPMEGNIATIRKKEEIYFLSPIPI